MTIPQFLAERYDILAPDATEGVRLRAYDTALDRDVGVTIFPEALVHDLAAWAKRVIEMEPTGLLVPEELGLDAEGRPYLVEPWPTGGVLEDPDRRLSPFVQASVLADAVATLSRLHGQGLAHGAFADRNIGIAFTDDGAVGLLTVPGLALLQAESVPTMLDDLAAAQTLAVRHMALVGHEFGGGGGGLGDIERALRQGALPDSGLQGEDRPPESDSSSSSNSDIGLEKVLRAVLALTEGPLADTPLQATLALALDVSDGTTALVCRSQQHAVMTLMATGEELAPGPWEDVVAVVVSDAIPRLAVVGVDDAGDRRWALIAPLMSSSLALVVASAPGQHAYGVDDLDRLSMFAVTAGLVLSRNEAIRGHGTQRRRFDVVLGEVQEAVIVLDASDSVVAVSAGGTRLLGVPADELVGASLSHFDGGPALWRAGIESRDGTAVVVDSSVGRLKVRSVELGADLILFAERDAANKPPRRRRAGALRYGFDDLVGESAGLAAVVADARLASRGDAAILITGESGTGKEVLAQAIHGESPRADAPFVAINVAAIPGELLESELFGYERGAFTGARSSGMQGKFEQANGGTLLLDEIGDMPVALQAKLLRVLQERRVQRLGGSREVLVDVRVISTTHRFLEKAVADGAFRLDLYYRLRVVHLELPALRDRPGDVPLLLMHHLSEACQRASRPMLRVAEHVMDVMKAHSWPGNVRELANVAEAWVTLTPPTATWIDAPPRDFGRVAGKAEGQMVQQTARLSESEVRPLADVERDAINAALEAFDGNLSKASRALGVSRGTLYNKLARYRGSV